MTRVVVIDDEPQIVRALRTSLQARGYDVVPANRGEVGINIIATQGADIVVLDLGLPDLDGTEVARRIRAFSDVPIIVLTVRDGQSDKIAALDAGADDYVTKPFAMEELLARMRAVLRRTVGDEKLAPSVFTFDELRVDLVKRLVTKRGEQVKLTPTEYRLFEALVTNPGKLLTHRWLLERVWGPGYSEETQYLRVFVGQLRSKIENEPSDPRWILTEPGVGYRWADIQSTRSMLKGP